jgi:hypothetical protein
MRVTLIIISVVLVLLTLCLAPSLESANAISHPVVAAVLNEGNWDQLAPAGKETDAIYGDVVLSNQYLVAVIARPDALRNANMTVHEVGGCLIDLTTATDQSDQLSAYYPGQRRYAYRSWTAACDGKAPVEPDDTFHQEGLTAAVTVHAAGGEDRASVDVTYSLGRNDRHLTVTSTWTNPTDAPITVNLVDDLRADGGKEDMVKSPNEVGDLFYVEDRFWKQAFGITAEGRQVLANSNSNISELKYIDENENNEVPLQAGESLTLTRTIAPGRNLFEVRGVFAGLAGYETTPVTLAIRDQSGGWVADARIVIHDGETTLGCATTDPRGEVTIPLEPGTYVADVSVYGRNFVNSRPLIVHAAVQQQESILLDDYGPGRLIARITDEDGRQIPCKVELTPRGDAPTPDFGPDTAEFGVRNLRYAPLGEFEQALWPGVYDVIVSHGPEFDAIFTEVEIKPGERTRLERTLVWTVDTTGWISSDFHSHSTPSGDNTSSQRGRVLNLVCEQIEFAPCTEHNRLSTYTPHINALGIGDFMATCTGMELTGKPLPLNHQNAFPLELHPHTQDGGAPVPDASPETQIERLALWDNRSDKLVQQNHPDLGWLFFDRDGDGKPDGGYSHSFGFIDVVEIHPLPQALDLGPVASLGGTRFNNRVFNWLQLLNQGYRIPGVSNTDAHYNYHGSGWLRVWIKSSTDDPPRIDTMEMVHAAEHGNLLMSNGPFLTVEASEAGADHTVTMGDDLKAPGGKVRLHVRVQCANWLDVNHLFVLVNGRVHPEHDYTRVDDPGMFGDGVIKFDHDLDLELHEDAHIVVVAGDDERSLEPVFKGTNSEIHPTAIANPIFVDVDGDGFEPNGDTLDAPLPVKLGG